MSACWDCGARQFSGALFCSECGADLLRPGEPGSKNATTPAFGGERPPRPPPLQLIGQEIAPQRDVRILRIVVASSGRRVMLSLDEEIVVGRADPTRDAAPALDLTEDKGVELGVSRRHAVIRQTEEGPAITDLNSTNGTSLNGRQLPPELPYRLTHGDELHFGDVVVHLFFELEDGEDGRFPHQKT